MTKNDLPEILVVDEHCKERNYLFIHWGQEEEKGDHKFFENSRFIPSLEEYEKVIAEYKKQKKWPQVIIFDDFFGISPNCITIIKEYIEKLRKDGFTGKIIMKYIFYYRGGWEKLNVDHIIELRRSGSEEIRKFLYGLGY